MEFFGISIFCWGSHAILSDRLWLVRKLNEILKNYSSWPHVASLSPSWPPVAPLWPLMVPRMFAMLDGWLNESSFLILKECIHPISRYVAVLLTYEIYKIYKNYKLYKNYKIWIMENIQNTKIIWKIKNESFETNVFFKCILALLL